MKVIQDKLVDVFIRNPFLDVYGSMKNPTTDIDIHEIEEWGNPKISSEVEQYIASYCPLHNIKEKKLNLRVMLSIGLEDLRVPPAQSLKWIQSILNAGNSESCILHSMESIGHEGPVALPDQALLSAQEICFLEDAVKQALKP